MFSSPELSIPNEGLISDNALSKSAWWIIFSSNLFLFFLSTLISEATDEAPFGFYPISSNKAKDVALLQTASISAPV